MAALTTERCPGSGSYVGGVGGRSARELGPKAACPVCGRGTSLTKRATIRQHTRPVPVSVPKRPRMTAGQKRWLATLNAEFQMNADHPPAPDGNLRISRGGLVFVIKPEGRVSVELAGGSFIPDVLDSDGPDYNPEALL